MKKELSKIQEIVNVLMPLYEKACSEKEEKSALSQEALKESWAIAERYHLNKATEAELEDSDKKLDAINDEYEAACDKYYCLDDVLNKLYETIEAMESYIYYQEG